MVRQLTTTLVLASLVAVGVAGALAGAWLGGRASEPNVQELVIADPALLDGAAGTALRTAGGFTGFGGLPALSGDVLLQGVVEEVGEQTIEIAAGGGTVTVRYRSPDRLFAVQSVERPLEAGDLVVLRIEDGVAVAVLRVPPDLEEGLGRGGRG